MENPPTILVVVAAALVGPDSRILMQRRPFAKHHGGLWEFPGGKVEPGETPEFALVRELNEELGITTDPGRLAFIGEAHGPTADGAGRIVIQLYRTDIWSGVPKAEEGAEIAWCPPESIAALPMPPLDIALLAQLFAEGR